MRVPRRGGGGGIAAWQAGAGPAVLILHGGPELSDDPDRYARP